MLDDYTNKTRNTLDCDQSNYSSRIVFSHILNCSGVNRVDRHANKHPDRQTNKHTNGHYWKQYDPRCTGGNKTVAYAVNTRRRSSFNFGVDKTFLPENAW